MTQTKGPLEGIRVLEFCWVIAGPYITMLLGSLGAEVIKVESHTRMDLLRRAVVWPLPEPHPIEVPPNQAMMFNSVNLNKKAIAVDLTRPQGRQLAKALVPHSDVVVDNLRPGAMDAMGLGYEELKALRPDLVMLSSSSRGQYGPERDYRGFAMLHHAIGGGAHITGYPDDHPSHSVADVDLMNATFAAFAILAALHHREMTGEGQFIDYSQCEGVSSVVGEALLAYEMSGRIPQRMGNAHPVWAPHNVYRCWGVDRWVAVEVHSDEEFASLTQVMGMPELAEDPRFSSMGARKANEQELDSIIESWTRKKDRDWIVRRLVEAGVHAAPSMDARDLYADGHLRERGAFVTAEHKELGPLELVSVPWKMTGWEMPKGAAPLLGEHTREVLSLILGMSDGEIESLRSEGIIA
jgi:crotonobetainyl-CoA:carnitine CoA-transferase CaiB-like acyl-CoA transferase